MQAHDEAYHPEWTLCPFYAGVLKDMRDAADRRRKKEEEEAKQASVH